MSVSNVVERLMSWHNVQFIRNKVGVYMDDAEIMHAVVLSYNHNLSKGFITGRRSGGRFDSDVRDEAIRLLLERVAIGKRYAAVASKRELDSGRQFDVRPTADPASYEDHTPASQPRPAHQYMANTRHSVVPLSNRDLSHTDTRRMRGLATVELTNSISTSSAPHPQPT